MEPFHHSEIPKGYAYVAMAFSFGVELLNMRSRKHVVKLVVVVCRPLSVAGPEVGASRLSGVALA